MLLAYVLLPPITAIGLFFHFRTLMPRPPKEMRISPKTGSIERGKA
ncbi:MAG: hypothetical protein QXZ65_04630 [Metallosphaera sp.]